MPSEPSREAREAAEALCPAPKEVHEEWAAQGWRCLSCITKARALDEFARKWRESWKQEHDSALEALAERDALRRRVAVFEEDLRCAAGDLPVALPEPGTDMARLVTANAALRRRVAELEADAAELRGAQIVNQNAIRIQKARAEAAERALDEIAELDPEELGENDDEWGGAAVGARAQKIAEEARRGRGDG